MLFVRQGATHKVVIGPAVAVGDGFTPVTTLSLASADEAAAILHDNGTIVDISGYTMAAITSADAYYHLTLQSGISGTVGHVTIVINDDSLILPVKAEFTVLEEAVYDALFAASAPGPAVAGDEMDLVDAPNATAVTAIQNGLSTHAAADVWSVGTRVLTAGTNIQLPSNGLANITAWTVAITGNITGNLSGSVGSVTGAVGSVTGNVGGNVTGSVGSLATQAKADVNAEVDGAIETYFTFTVTGQADANIQYVNDVAVTGDGQTGTEWGPA